MASPDRATPLDAERARLRTAGLTDDEISRIFVSRELGASAQQAGAGASAGAPTQAQMSGVTNNVTAVLAHVRGVIPAVASQILTVRDRSASAAARLAAFLSLTAKAALIFVFGYAVFQEWNQHIISATQIAASQAEFARQRQQAETSSAIAAAEYAVRIKKAEADKMEADARLAEAKAGAATLPASSALGGTSDGMPDGAYRSSITRPPLVPRPPRQ